MCSSGRILVPHDQVLYKARRIAMSGRGDIRLLRKVWLQALSSGAIAFTGTCVAIGQPDGGDPDPTELSCSKFQTEVVAVLVFRMTSNIVGICEQLGM